MAKGGAVKALATCFAQSELISSNLGRLICSPTSEGSVHVLARPASAIGTQTHPLKLEVFDEEWNSFNERTEVPAMVP